MKSDDSMELHITLVGSNRLLVAVRGLISMPAINDDIHDVFVDLVGCRLSGCDTHAQVGGIETCLDGLVEGKAHGGLHIAVLGVQGRVLLQSLRHQRLVLVGQQREVSDGVNAS